MYPVATVIAPGLLGALVLAWLIRIRQRHHGSELAAAADAFRVEPLSTDFINMASVKVAGSRQRPAWHNRRTTE